MVINGHGGHSYCMQSKYYFTRMITKHWLPRKVGKSPSFEVFRTSLDKALSNLIWIQYWPYFKQEFGLETFWGPIRPEWFCESVKQNGKSSPYSHDISFIIISWEPLQSRLREGIVQTLGEELLQWSVKLVLAQSLLVLGFLSQRFIAQTMGRDVIILGLSLEMLWATENSWQIQPPQGGTCLLSLSPVLGDSALLPLKAERV